VTSGAPIVILIPLVMAGCWDRASPTTPTTATGREFGEPAATGTVGTRLTGRVLKDGVPVKEFALALAHDAMAPDQVMAPIVVHGDNGYFDVVSRPGEFDVVVVGKEFARKIILHVIIEKNAVKALGDIQVIGGATVRGAVLDEGHVPVGDIPVRISQSGLTAPSGYYGLAVGNYEVMTDAKGQFVFENYAPIQLRVQRPMISATLPKQLSSGPTALGDQRVVTLVLHPVGDLEGQILDGNGDPLTGGPLGVSMVAYGTFKIWIVGASDLAGAFHFNDVPEGEYSLRVGDSAGQRVAISAGKTSQVQVRYTQPP